MNNHISDISGKQYINDQNNISQGKQKTINNDLFKDAFQDALKTNNENNDVSHFKTMQRPLLGSLEELASNVNLNLTDVDVTNNINIDTDIDIDITNINITNNIGKISNNYSETNVVNYTNNLINLLDNYSQGLGNSNTTLKDLEPLINNIQTDAEKLLKETQEAPLEDTKLKDIATQTAMAANIEFLKFNRGDYL